MRFQVPQFIGVEDKIFFGFTFKQFLYLVGGAGMCFVLLRVLPLFIGVLLCVPVVALVLALTFKQVNNKPFIFFLENAFSYFFKRKLYIWSNEKRKQVQPSASAPSPVSELDPLLSIPKLSNSKLQKMEFGIDLHNNAPTVNQ